MVKYRALALAVRKARQTFSQLWIMYVQSQLKPKSYVGLTSCYRRGTEPIGCRDVERNFLYGTCDNTTSDVLDTTENP